ncbi:MAG: hypothetical protein ACK4WH_07980 [Phycisphaerales bacterium]
MSHSPDIPDEALIAYLLGESGAADSRSIAQAVAASAGTAARLDRLRSVIGSVREAGRLAPLFHVDPARLAALRALAPAPRREQSTLADSAGELVRHIAAMVFDSWAQPAPAGFRGVSAERLVRFAYPGGSVDLQIIPDSASVGRFWIIGHAQGWRSGRVESRSSSSDGSAACDIGPDGYFELCVHSGLHTLEVRTPSGEVVIGPIEVGPR